MDEAQFGWSQIEGVEDGKGEKCCETQKKKHSSLGREKVKEREEITREREKTGKRRRGRRERKERKRGKAKIKGSQGKRRAKNV